MFRLFIISLGDLLVNNKSSINTDIMNFLSIDFSMNSGSLFIKTKSKTFSKILQSDKSGNDLLMKRILDFFAENKLKFSDIEQIFVNQGPGNFSGLRASLAIAKGISLSKNLNLYGYNNFLWPCSKFYNKKNTIFSLIKLREKYFIKKFDRQLKSTSKAEIIKKEDIVKKYAAKFLVISKSIEKSFDKKILEHIDFQIADLDHNELESLKLKGLLDKNLIKPIYLS